MANIKHSMFKEQENIYTMFGVANVVHRKGRHELEGNVSEIEFTKYRVLVLPMNQYLWLTLLFGFNGPQIYHKLGLLYVNQKGC